MSYIESIMDYMELMMTYDEKFALFGLDTTKLVNYSSPEQYAKQFKRCTVLNNDDVSYTSRTISNDDKKENKENSYHQY